jgi:hypothetical protein
MSPTPHHVLRLQRDELIRSGLCVRCHEANDNRHKTTKNGVPCVTCTDCLEHERMKIGKRRREAVRQFTSMKGDG